MKIELKNVKYATWNSEETHCFTASVYIDGVRAFSAENQGHGGSTSFHPFKPYDKNRKLLQEAEAYAKSLPPIVTENFTLDNDLELLVGELLENHLRMKEFKHWCKTAVVFRVKGLDGMKQADSWRTVKGSWNDQRLRQYLQKRHGSLENLIVLNEYIERGELPPDSE